MESALTYTLQRVHWQVFGSLTFLSWKVPDRVRVHMALLLRIRFALQEYAATATKAVTALDLTKRQ